MTVRKRTWIGLAVVLILILAGLVVQITLFRDDGVDDPEGGGYDGDGDENDGGGANDTGGEENGTGDVVLTLSSDNGTANLTMSDIFDLDNVSGAGGYIATGGDAVGPFTYKGAGALDVLDLVGGMGVAQSLLVKGADGTETLYTYTQVEGNVATYDENGLPTGYGGVTMLLAYSISGDQGMEGGPLRVAYVEPGTSDGKYTSEILWTEEVVSMEIL